MDPKLRLKGAPVSSSTAGVAVAGVRVLALAGVFLVSLAGCHRPNQPPAPAGPAAEEREDEPSAPSGPADTPEEAVRQYEAAVRTGNLDAFLGVLAEPDRKQFLELKDVLQAYEKAREALDEALNARFGKNPFTDIPNEKIDFKRVIHHRGMKIEIVRETPEGADRVRLALKFTNPAEPGEPGGANHRSFTAVKEGGGWKLSDNEKGRSVVEFHQKQTRVYQQVTAGVKDGKYKDVKEALRALQEAEAGKNAH
jgi:hypothetical protein